MSRPVFFQYFIWHFFDASGEILLAWKNYLVFYFDYFSVFTLLKTFFSPWHKYRYPYGKAWDPWRYFEAFVFNTFSRLIGVVLRTLVIIAGFLTEISIIITGALIFIGWLVLPALLLCGLILGVRLCLI